MMGLPTLDAAEQALSAARTETEVLRAGLRLIAVAILERSNYDDRVPIQPEEEQWRQ
jgi:hypothetical protein